MRQTWQVGLVMVGAVATPAALVAADDRTDNVLGRDAQAHLAAGRYREAHDAYAGWRPVSFCGTCEAMMQDERSHGMALCLAYLNDHPAAARVGLRAVGAGTADSSLQTAVLLFELYRDAGQLGDLTAMLDRIEQRLLAAAAKTGPVDARRRRDLLEYAPTWEVREMMRIADLGAKKDVAALVALCQDSRSAQADTFDAKPYELRGRVAADALAACGDGAVGPVRDAIRARRGSVSWLIYALGRSPTPAALDVLRDLAREEKSWNCGNVAYALALKGEPGRKLLLEIASTDTNGMRAAAVRRLEQPAPRSGPPKPKPGSLPKALPD
jgi:hypothetical protein